MNIICNQRSLLHAINNAQKAINNKSTTEKLKGILISTQGTKVSISGCDDEIYINTIIDAKINKPGEIVVNSRLLGDIVRKLPDTFISIETDNEYNIFINCMHSRFKIKGVSSDDFPVAEEVNIDNMIKFDQLELKTMIRQTVFATSTDTSRPTFTGELFEVINNKVNMVAIDGYRLAVRKSSLDEEVSTPIKAIIPRNTLNHINSLLSDEGDVFIGIDSKNIIFKIANTTIVARLLEGVFSKYENMLPKDYITKIEVDTKQLQNAIERASLLVTTKQEYMLKISIREKVMDITSNNENGNAYEELEIDFEGEPLNIAFNSKYFLEGIKNIDSEKLSIEFGGPMNPCIIKPISGPEYIYLILPVRLATYN